MVHLYSFLFIVILQHDASQVGFPAASVSFQAFLMVWTCLDMFGPMMASPTTWNRMDRGTLSPSVHVVWLHPKVTLQDAVDQHLYQKCVIDGNLIDSLLLR